MDCAQVRGWRFPLARASILLALLFLPLLPTVAAAGDEWKFDVLHLKNGGSFKGLIVEESESEIRFRIIRQRPGEATGVTTTTTFSRDEITRIEKLSVKDRDILKDRLNALDPTGQGERARMEELTLKPVAWVRKDDSQALCYESAHFVLLSNAREEIVRRAAVRLEEIYAAYARYLPPRRKAGKPTTIILVRTMAEYRELLKAQGRNILNPAFYDLARNEVYCALELEDLGKDLERVRKKHAELLAQLKKQEQKLLKDFRGKPPAALLNPLRTKRKEIELANKKNDAIFEQASKQFFQTLYHESFHAYLAMFVYPPEEADVPRWLNEGLAQIFETAIVEAGELRIGYAGKDRLDPIQAAARKKELIPLPKLLRSGPKQFLVAHAGDRQISDEHYLNSWALAFYLMFDRQILGTSKLDEYVKSLKRGTEPVEAFSILVGKTPGQFEKDYQQYLLKLRSDGTVAKKNK